MSDHGQHDWIVDFYAEYSSYFTTGLPKETDEVVRYVRKFTNTLIEIGATEIEALKAMNAMAEHPPEKRSDHLKLLIGKIKAIKAAATTQARPQARKSASEHQAQTNSIDCPECLASGWAKRRAHYIGQFTLALPMFCRCEYGRWKKEYDPNINPGAGGRQRHDLQAFPELWDWSIDHPTWTEDHVADDNFNSTGGEWYYLAPADAKPAMETSTAPTKTKNRTHRLSGTLSPVVQTPEEKRATDARREAFNAMLGSLKPTPKEAATR